MTTRKVTARGIAIKRLSVGGVINSTNSAIPVADKYMEPISYLVAIFVDRGDYVSYQTEYRQLTGMIPMWTNERQQGSKVSAVLTIALLAAPFLTTFVATSLGLGIYVK